ncbi:MAG: (2Fe-2S) ferredoxin domain-containing protein [Firmicutes bacterium]|nr:(2Fe-2S) ferredoxin domain-containing protein [Bacillota bacterium]
MISLDDLRRIRDEALATIALREAGGNVQLIVGMGTCGIAAGAREVMQAVLDELEKRRLTEVLVSQTGCMGLCAQEPLVEVVDAEGRRVVYKKVDPSRVRQIIVEHVVNGRIIPEWTLNVTEGRQDG